jgi:hypothetical protein
LNGKGICSGALGSRIRESKIQTFPSNIFVGPLSLPQKLDWDGVGSKNPGIGGTEFQLLSLAEFLAEKSLGSVKVLCNPVPVISGGSGVEFEPFDLLSPLPPESILISPVSSLVQMPAEFTKNTKLIASSHHPHDHDIPKIVRRHAPLILRCVGAYSYWSNARRGVSSVYLPNLFLSQELDLDSASRELAFGHLSSLHPSKGLIVAIGVWNKARQLGGSTPKSFEVIGGQAIYDAGVWKASAALMSPGYEKRVEKLLGEGLDVAGIRLFGIKSNADMAPLVARWSGAILNPLGTGEADPASYKDCLAVGVPVFSLGDYGMWDYARYFPETTARTLNQLTKKIVRFSMDPELRTMLRVRALQKAAELKFRNSTVLENWSKLLHYIHEGAEISATGISAFIPPRLPVALRFKLVTRRLIFFIAGGESSMNWIRERISLGVLRRWR